MGLVEQMQYLKNNRFRTRSIPKFVMEECRKLCDSFGVRFIEMGHGFVMDVGKRRFGIYRYQNLKSKEFHYEISWEESKIWEKEIAYSESWLYSRITSIVKAQLYSDSQ